MNGQKIGREDMDFTEFEEKIRFRAYTDIMEIHFKPRETLSHFMYRMRKAKIKKVTLVDLEKFANS